jgi:putative mRNA 3-end processing factor
MACRVSCSKSGISVEHGDRTILLDPSRSVECDLSFVSHAHVDHLHRRGKKQKSTILSSSQTARIAGARGYEMSDSVEEYDGFGLIDTGHILGSRGLLVGEDELFYTGDISIRERMFLKPAGLPHVKTLIIESTFGRPGYIFPSISNVAHRTNEIISEMYNSGIPVILMGYSLGKAQLLTKMFGGWDPVYLHDSVANMNSVYSELGVELKDALSSSEAESEGLLSNSPWVMIAPLMSGRSKFVKEMKEKYGAVTVGFSGWASGTRYKYMMGLDHVMPLSDHCDYKELVDAVKQCRPKKVYTFHGFAAEFAQSLRKLGFDALPVEGAGQDKDLSLDAFR